MTDINTMVSPTSTYPPPGPDPRVFARKPLCLLRADLRGQRHRNFDEVEFIVEDFDWGKLEVFTVVDNGDGTYNITEGQGRWLALFTAFGPDFEVPVMILPPMTVEDQASTARGIDSGRRSFTAYHRWNLDITANDPHVLAAMDVLSEAGLRVAQAKNKDGSVIACAATLRHLMTASRRTPAAGAHLLSLTVKVITEAFPVGTLMDNSSRWETPLMRAVSGIIARHADLNENTVSIDISRLIAKMSAFSAAEWLKFGKTSKDNAHQAIEAKIIEEYNRHLRTGRLA